MFKKVISFATATSAIELQTDRSKFCSNYAHDVGKMTWTDLDRCVMIDCIYNGLQHGLAKLDILPG